MVASAQILLTTRSSFHSRKQKKENVKMLQKKRIKTCQQMKNTVGQQTKNSCFPASSTASPVPDSDRPTKSISALCVPTSATTIYVATKMQFYLNFYISC